MRLTTATLTSLSFIQPYAEIAIVLHVASSSPDSNHLPINNCCQSCACHCKMAKEPQQKRSEVRSVECEDRLLDMFPELVDSNTKVGQGSSEIGAAIQHLKLVSGVSIATAL